MSLVVASGPKQLPALSLKLPVVDEEEEEEEEEEDDDGVPTIG